MTADVDSAADVDALAAMTGGDSREADDRGPPRVGRKPVGR